MTLNDRVNSAIIANYQISDALQSNTDLGFNVGASYIPIAQSNSMLSTPSRNAGMIAEDTPVYGSFGNFFSDDAVSNAKGSLRGFADKALNKAVGEGGSWLDKIWNTKGDPNTPNPYTGNNRPKPKDNTILYVIGAVVLLKFLKK